MYKFKGFIGIESLVNNSQGFNSTIGEISTQSLTYAKEKGVYTSTAYPQLTLYSFSSKNDSTGAVSVPTNISSVIFAHTSWAHLKQIAIGAPIDRSVFLADYVAQFGDTASNIDCGEMVLWKNNQWFPEWISWKVLGLAASDQAVNNSIMVWFSDLSFNQQYDEFSITVVPPLGTIDTFFSGKSAVAAALAARTLTLTLGNVQTAKGGYPETIVCADTFDYVDPTNAANRIPTGWTLLIYGKAGNDSDAIRAAIRAYITAHTSHTEAEWRTIFPDIYKATEFLIFPRWRNVAIPDRALQEGIYSPVISLRKELDNIKLRLPGVTSAHIEAHTQVLPCNYKSLALVIVGGPDNRNLLYDITQVYPDLLNLPTSDTLFESMGEATQQWILLITRVLIAAERTTTYSDIPTEFQRVARAGVIYVSASVGNVAYLVATKNSTLSY